MLYLDSSAIVKLVSRELETEALAERLATDSEHVSSALAFVEVLRAVRRITQGEEGQLVERARSVLSRIALIRIDRPVLRNAAEVGSPELRTPDAIHLATVFSLPSEPALITYDRRLYQAATENGLIVESPGSGTAGR